jgi:hypothetical protein
MKNRADNTARAEFRSLPQSRIEDYNRLQRWPLERQPLKLYINHKPVTSKDESLLQMKQDKLCK